MMTIWSEFGQKASVRIEVYFNLKDKMVNQAIDDINVTKIRRPSKE